MQKLGSADFRMRPNVIGLFKYKHHTLCGEKNRLHNYNCYYRPAG